MSFHVQRWPDISNGWLDIPSKGGKEKGKKNRGKNRKKRKKKEKGKKKGEVNKTKGKEKEGGGGEDRMKKQKGKREPSALVYVTGFAKTRLIAGVRNSSYGPFSSTK